MKNEFFLTRLDQLHSSYLVLLSLAGLVLVAGLLFQIGLIGLIVGILGRMVRASVQGGFQLWERLLAWATWPVFLIIVLGVLVAGWSVHGNLPAMTVVCSLVPLFMGVTACLAYMHIDLERYEVERGYKAVHNPLKGQELAEHLVRYGQRVDIPLLVAATVGMIGGFALLNLGLYDSIGRDWYTVGDQEAEATYVDFLAYALINLLRIVDVLNLATSHHLLGVTYVRQASWPATTMLAVFRTFFTFVLLQQVFASLRQGRLLSETITDLWSPHEPIHERARNALPQYGPAAIGPLLVSLRSVTSLTKEQRDQLPKILAAIGPSTVPYLVRHLQDPNDQVRAIAVAALGQLHARDTVPLMVRLAHDPSDIVRQSLVEALGLIGESSSQTMDKRPGRARFLRLRGTRIWKLFWRNSGVVPGRATDLSEIAVSTLQAALADESVSVRTLAARSLGLIGVSASCAAPTLIALLKDENETERCEAAEALGKIGGDAEATVSALIELLEDASAPIKVSAARALGNLKKAAASAVPNLVSLLQDREEGVRTAAAEAIGQIGLLNEGSADTLIEGLANPDNMVRAQMAEALGTIGTQALETAPALVDVMTDSNDVVRAKAVEALGKIGEAAASVAVPGLMQALKDQDNWVSALAAEALGQMGESADEAIPALTRSMGHINPQVRANAAEALGKMGEAAARSRTVLENACLEEDGDVRNQAVRALGLIGPPTPDSKQAVLKALQDPDPLARAAAVESVGQWNESSEAVLTQLVALLEDANDQVKVQASKVLPKLAGATPAVIESLCRRLLEDDSVWVQVHAALALSKLGAAAQAAGGALLQAAKMGEASVREQAMRAIAVIQPPGGTLALAEGLKDPSGEIRMVASGGLMKAKQILSEVIPGLVDALRDPEIQVRANAAHILGRIDFLPAEAIGALIECTTNSNDSLRINAAMALKAAPPGAVAEVMKRLIEDPNLRVRLIAASVLVTEEPENAQVTTVLEEALTDPTPRLRKAAIELIDSLGTGGLVFLNIVQQRLEAESDPKLREMLTGLIERLKQHPVENPNSGSIHLDSEQSAVHEKLVGI